MSETPRGIDGLRDPTRPRQPVGCALSMGRKGPGNAPIDKHRFFIVRPVADASGKDGRRDAHPQFAEFNKLAPPAQDSRNPTPQESAIQKAHDEKRATIRGVLVHARPEECWTNRRQASRLRGHEHPRQGPSCMGNGQRAQRWMPRSERYEDIPCPGAQCPFAMGEPGKKKDCSPHTKLIFQLVFVNMPSMLCKFTSNGWETTGAIDAFFDDIERQARILGVAVPSFYGVPFTLTISRRTGNGNKWTVVHMSPDFPPGMTLQGFLLSQVETRRQLAGGMEMLMIGTGATLDDDNENDDHHALHPTRVPIVLDVPSREGK